MAEFLRLHERRAYEMHRAGVTHKEMARRLGIAESSLGTMLTNLRNRGHYLPKRSNGGSNGVKRPGDGDPENRYVAEGVTPNGCRVSVASDSQSEANAQLAALGADQLRSGRLVDVWGR